MDIEWLAFAKAAWWLLTPLVVLLPLRWSILAYILLAQFDLSGPGFASASEVGLENAIKTVILPIILLLRMRVQPILLRWPVSLKIWSYLTAFVGLAALWSPFTLSATKMIGYMLSYLLLFLVFRYAWHVRLLNLRIVSYSLLGSLFVAVLQTFYLGHPFGGDPSGRGPVRFTSFSSPQSFAAYLVATNALLWLAGEKIGAFWPLSLASVVGLFFTGSRYAYIGLAALGLTSLLVWASSSQDRYQQTGRLAVVIPGVLVLASAFLVVPLLVPGSRVAELSSVLTGRGTLGDIGTFAWRLTMYQITIEQISSSGAVQILFGHGTSSGAGVALAWSAIYSWESIDANRVFHNEFLRSLYEWGVVGFSLLVAFLVGVIFSTIKLFSRQMKLAGPTLGILPMLLAALAIENIMAASGSPGGVGFLLTLSYTGQGASERGNDGNN